jgi:hypothetical protein
MTLAITSSPKATAVGGRRFSDPEDFAAFAGGETLVLRPGESFSIALPDCDPSAHTCIRGFGAGSPFSVRTGPEAPPASITLTARADAWRGTSEHLRAETFDRYRPGITQTPRLTTHFKLKVG